MSGWKGFLEVGGREGRGATRRDGFAHALEELHFSQLM